MDVTLDLMPLSSQQYNYQSRVQRQRVVVKIEHADVHASDQGQISSLCLRVEAR